MAVITDRLPPVPTAQPVTYGSSTHPSTSTFSVATLPADDRGAASSRTEDKVELLGKLRGARRCRREPAPRRHGQFNLVRKTSPVPSRSGWSIRVQQTVVCRTANLNRSFVVRPEGPQKSYIVPPPRPDRRRAGDRSRRLFVARGDQLETKSRIYARAGIRLLGHRPPDQQVEVYPADRPDGRPGLPVDPDVPAGRPRPARPRRRTRSRPSRLADLLP